MPSYRGFRSAAKSAFELRRRESWKFPVNHRRGDRDPQMKHRRNQRHHPGQRPATVLAVPSRRRALLEPELQPSQLLADSFGSGPDGPCRGQRRADAPPAAKACRYWQVDLVDTSSRPGTSTTEIPPANVCVAAAALAPVMPVLPGQRRIAYG
jgi:hypothetical protein